MNRHAWDSDESKPTRRRRDPEKRRDQDRLPRLRPGRPVDDDDDDFEIEEDDLDIDDDDLDPDFEDEDEKDDWDEPSDEELDGLLGGLDEDEFYRDEDSY